MKKIKNFILGEFSGWKYYELIFLFLVYLIVFYNSICLNDNIFAVIAAFCGTTATITAGKGKISTFLFGMAGNICYAYMSYKSTLYGNCLLNLCYYFPMQFIGIYFWKKNLKSDRQEIIKTQLSKKDFILIFSLLFLSCLIGILLLNKVNDVHPIIDSITTIGSIFGVFLTVKRCFEQWYIWFVVNGLTLYMWITIVLAGTKAYSTVIQWGAYFIIGIYFLIQWRKELKNNSNKIL